MCTVFGALLKAGLDADQKSMVNSVLKHIYMRAHDRGRDGRGFEIKHHGGLLAYRSTRKYYGDPSTLGRPYLDESVEGVVQIIGNTRAEPTTEFVRAKRKIDQQPYAGDNWSIVHNGTIANDKELRTNTIDTIVDSAAIVEQLDKLNATDARETFEEVVLNLKGSYAIIAVNHNEMREMFVAANYRPIWYIDTDFGIFFASSRNMFPQGVFAPQMLEPYTMLHVTLYSDNVSLNPISLRHHKRENAIQKPKALVVCSGGLDSVVSAVYAQKVLNYDVELIHFLYGSRAQAPEARAIQEVAVSMGVSVKLFPLPIYEQADSPLLDPESKVAGGEAGAEFAFEWVPARNLLLLAVATAYAEAKGFRYIVLGSNLEEAGAYPDNEPEFIDRFNDLLPFAVGVDKQVQVLMPVGNMMKHEIVALGHKLQAPMHLTWSCYRAGKMHCGKCGPCFMRRTAFQINNIDEVIEYDS